MPRPMPPNTPARTASSPAEESVAKRSSSGVVDSRLCPPTLTTMRYISTRGDSQNSTQKSFTEILLGGLAPDGGLYIPETYPQISRAELDQWRTLSYADLAFAVMLKFIDDIPAADLKALVDKTY